MRSPGFNSQEYRCECGSLFPPLPFLWLLPLCCVLFPFSLLHLFCVCWLSLHSLFSAMPARGRHAGCKFEILENQMLIEFEYSGLPRARNKLKTFLPLHFLLNIVSPFLCSLFFPVCCFFSPLSLFRHAGQRPGCRLTA